MTMKTRFHCKTAVPLLVAALALSACSSTPKGIRVTNGGASATTSKQAQPIRLFTAAEIVQSISGKTFQYTRADGNGFVTYNADGSFDFQDDTRGAGKGRWSANGQQYCEMFGAGKPQECGVFKYTGDAYFAANSRLVEMKG
jgi:acid phosphatase class B